MKHILHIYTRVSSAVQEEGTSLETQKELGIKKSKELGMEFKIWNEGAASSHHEILTNRPKISELLLEINNGIKAKWTEDIFTSIRITFNTILNT
jgi:DNA invertase Pin-like site-specific DNA recombinase